MLEEIERCSAVIRAEGDTLEAERWSRQREKESGQRYLLPDLLFRWALEDDEQRTDPEVRCFSIMKLCGLLADGFLEFAGQYREKYQDLFRNGREGFLIEIGGWKATCFPSRVTEAEYSLRRHTIRTLPRRILSDPYTFFAMGAWIVSLIVFLIAAGRHAPLIVTASILTGVISIAAIILRARGLWINLLDDCSVYTETLNAVMEQAVFWEEAYQEADRWNDDLLSLIEGCRGMEDLII